MEEPYAFREALLKASAPHDRRPFLVAQMMLPLQPPELATTGLTSIYIKKRN